MEVMEEYEIELKRQLADAKEDRDYWRDLALGLLAERNRGR